MRFNSLINTLALVTMLHGSSRGLPDEWIACYAAPKWSTVTELIARDNDTCLSILGGCDVNVTIDLETGSTVSDVSMSDTGDDMVIHADVRLESVCDYRLPDSSGMRDTVSAMIDPENPRYQSTQQNLDSVRKAVKALLDKK